MKKVEHRTYQFEIRAEDGENGIRKLYGTPIVYESETDIGGWFSETIERGALIGANLKDVPLLVNHDQRMIPVARSRNNTPNSTMRLVVTDNGLEIEADIDTDRNATARALYSAVERGDINGMSFAFTVDGEEWENLQSDYPKRRITKFGEIVEVSAVTWPAYEATNISVQRAATDDARSVLESARSQKAHTLDSANLELLKEKSKLY